MNKICQNCKFFKQPICFRNDEFRARKFEGCIEFEVNKNKKIKTKELEVKEENDIIQKVFVETDPDILKNTIFKRPEIKRSKNHKRK